MNIVIFGPQGSGKGTQARKLAEKFGLMHFSIGELLREVAKTRPEIDEVVNKEGELLPDEVTMDIVAGFLEERNKFDDIIFDGFPRNMNQHNLLRDWLASKGKKIDVGILINISDTESVRRLSGRRKDPKTGKTYNLLTNPPGPEVDVSRLEQREDDKEEAVKTRLSIYHEETAPIASVLEEESTLITVDGEREIDEIFEDIVASLERINE